MDDAEEQFLNRIADGYSVRDGGVWVPSETNPDIDITVTLPDDPAQMLLQNPDVYTIPEVYDENCYICNDPEFAQMGLPLCKSCPDCGDGKGHVPADDVSCTVCGSSSLYDAYMSDQPEYDIEEGGC